MATIMVHAYNSAQLVKLSQFLIYSLKPNRHFHSEKFFIASGEKGCEFSVFSKTKTVRNEKNAVCDSDPFG